jgi:hypothetical protein
MGYYTPQGHCFRFLGSGGVGDRGFQYSGFNGVDVL